MSVEHYAKLVTSQHRGAPRFMAWVRFLVSLFNVNVCDEMTEAFSLEQAQGAQLDALGALEDEMYRRLLRARIIRNQFRGQQGELAAIWETVFGDELGLTVADNQDMTMSVDLSAASYSPEMLSLLLHGFIVPKPLGVGMRYRLVSSMPRPMGSACECSLYGVIAIPGDTE